MLYKFRLLSNEVREFVRDVEILSDQTFYDFHRILTCDFHYDKSQIVSFFLSNENWEKLTEITLFDMSEKEDKREIYIMDQIRLDEFITRKRQRLLYVFDFFNERLLFIELIATSQTFQKAAYPRISLSNGPPPQQLLTGNNNFEDLRFDE